MPVANLILPGAGKSGTSSLHDYLHGHPDVYMSRPKEPHFFAKPERYARGLAAYAALFAGAGDAAVRGESSTTYLLFSQAVAPRIAAALPDVKLVFLLRNPVSRIDSHFRWLCSLGLEDRPLRAAVSGDLRRRPRFEDRIGGHKFAYYHAESAYAARLADFYEHFAAEQILVLTTEELAARPLDTLNAVAAFAGVAPFARAPQGRSNVTGAGGPALSGADRSWLAGLLADDVAGLAGLTGRRFPEWAADFAGVAGTEAA